MREPLWNAWCRGETRKRKTEGDVARDGMDGEGKCLCVRCTHGGNVPKIWPSYFFTMSNPYMSYILYGFTATNMLPVYVWKYKTEITKNGIIAIFFFQTDNINYYYYYCTKHLSAAIQGDLLTSVIRFTFEIARNEKRILSYGDRMSWTQRNQ